jgi:Uma2 family endonuclease
MSSAVKILPHYTYDEWKEWKDRWELIDGVPYAMSPAPAPRHQWISANIKGEFRNSIKSAGCKKCKVYDFIDIKVSEDTILQPDAVIVCKEIPKNFLDFPAAMVVEILSPATALKDRNNKFTIYEAQKISYYLIVDIEKKEIEIYRLNKDGKYEGEKFSPAKPYTFILDTDCYIDVVLNNIWE